MNRRTEPAQRENVQRGNVQRENAQRENPERESTATRLLASSAKLSYDPDVDIDWNAPIPDDKFWVPENLVTLNGTRLWRQMSQQQRIELSKQEMISTLSMGIWFETVLMQMLLQLTYRKDPTTKHVQYAFTEVADECRHSTMFGRLIEHAGGRPYKQNRFWYPVGLVLPFILRGPSMWAGTLMGEEVVDVLQRESMRDENVQPIVRAVMKIHVTEEARHVGYARPALLNSMRHANAWQRFLGRFVAAAASLVIATQLTRPEQYQRAGLPPYKARFQAWTSRTSRANFRRGASRVVAFLTEAGLIGGPTKIIWRISGLI